MTIDVVLAKVLDKQFECKINIGKAYELENKIIIFKCVLKCLLDAILISSQCCSSAVASNRILIGLWFVIDNSKA